MSGMQPESVIFSQGHKSRSRLIVIIQEALGEDLIRTPLKVDPPAFRGGASGIQFAQGTQEHRLFQRQAFAV